MHILADAANLTTVSMVFLVLAVGLALAFEFVNGFHDTANAVATVIYTHTLPPWVAVIWSGGVLESGSACLFHPGPSRSASWRCCRWSWW